ncbi:MAG: DUF503 domain-containing protein [Chloroflexi bacterium]|nr:DUF503 domain-containing protein [Chloroflexota bacterium]
MNIGVCRIQLRLPDSGTLKDKRQVVRSISSRVRNRFNVSIAEVEDNDLHQHMTLGISCVSNDSRHANEVLSHVVEFIRSSRLDAELVDYELEIIAGV